MRFKLLEAPTREWPPSRQTIDRFNALKTLDQKKAFLNEHILPHPMFKKIFGIRQVIFDSIISYGLDPKRNFFLSFVSKIKFPMPDAKTYKNKMRYIYDSFKNNKIDLKMPVLLNETLYQRNENEFKYAVNAFSLMSNPKKAGAYIKNTDVIDINDFMDGNTVKPSGNDGRQGDTIFNVIEGWAEGNEYSPEEIANNKNKLAAEEEENKKSNKTNSNITININDQKDQWDYKYFKDILEKIFANKSKFNISNGNKNFYLERVFATFELPNIQVSETENKLYKKSFSDVKDNDVTQFGNPHEIDTPIHLKVRTTQEETPGIYVFHQFVPLDNTSSNYYAKIANTNKGTLERHLNQVQPNNDNDVNIHLQAVIDALDKLTGLQHK